MIVSNEEIYNPVHEFKPTSAGGGTKLTSNHLRKMLSVSDNRLKRHLVDALARLATPKNAKQSTPGTVKVDHWSSADSSRKTRQWHQTYRSWRNATPLGGLNYNRTMQTGRPGPLKTVPVWRFLEGWRRKASKYSTKMDWCVRASSRFGIIQIDFANAFNLVSGRVLVLEVRRHIPQIAKSVEFCYGTENGHPFGLTISWYTFALRICYNDILSKTYSLQPED